MKYIKEHWKQILGAITVAFLVQQAYLYWSKGNTGFETITLWNWLELLIIPAALFIGGYFLTRGENQTDREIAKENREQEQQIAHDRQQQLSLQNYFDRMSSLLLEHKLRETQPEDEVRSIARSITLSALRTLDDDRKGALIQFLFESKLIDVENGIISLEGADLKEAYLYEANLQEANLRGADLRLAHMTYANLRQANLTEAILIGANLAVADLRQANLIGTNLAKAYLPEANLIGILLTKANLIGADLRETDLQTANLRGADLREVDLTGANLARADLTGANLARANLTGVDLEKANLTGAILE